MSLGMLEHRKPSLGVSREQPEMASMLRMWIYYYQLMVEIPIQLHYWQTHQTMVLKRLQYLIIKAPKTESW